MNIYQNMAIKIFSEICCSHCTYKFNGIEDIPQYESTPILETDNMGRYTLQP